MIDPVLLGLLDALRHHDASAQPALVDYLLERNDERAEAVRHGQHLAQILDLFSARKYLSAVAQRLQARGLNVISSSIARTCYISRQMREAGFLLPHYLAEAVSVVERPELDQPQLLRLTAEDYQFAKEWFPARPFGTGEAYYLSYSLVIVPGLASATSEVVRRGKLRRRWRMVGWGYEIPVIFDPLSRELHCFERMPLLMDRKVYQAARSLIVETLSPPRYVLHSS